MERGGAPPIFSRPFRKHGVFPLAAYVDIYEKDDIVDIKGMGTVQKGTPHKCYGGETGRAYSVTQHAVGTVVNKLRARFLPRELVYVLSILSTQRAEIAS